MNDDKAIFYHLRDPQGNPHVTVCLLRKGDKLSRGVAICSLKDNFSYKIGRIIARGRAEKAIVSRISRPVRVFKRGHHSDAYLVLRNSGGAYLSDKADPDPTLTQFEKNMITSAGRLQDTDEVYRMAHLENEILNNMPRQMAC